MEETTNEVTEKNEVVEETKGTERQQKLFTQEEVDTIIKKRLGRVKEENSKELEEKQAKLSKEYETKESTLTKQLEEKEYALKQREIKVNCKEYLIKKNYPAELIDIISAESEENFIAKVEQLITLTQKQYVAPLADYESSGIKKQDDFFNTKHKPEGTIKDYD